MVSLVLFYQITIDSRIFRTMLSFRKSYTVFLGFSESGLYLIDSLYNKFLGFSKVVISAVLF